MYGLNAKEISRVPWPTVEIGDTVKRKIRCGPKMDEIGLLEGTVIYIHPEERFHVVEFHVNGHTIRQAYLGTFDIDDWLKIPYIDGSRVPEKLWE